MLTHWSYIFLAPNHRCIAIYLRVMQIPMLPKRCFISTFGTRWLPLVSRWRHQMETFSALLALCAGNSPVTGEFPAQRPVTRSFDVSFDPRLNKRLSKQSLGWWFETPWCPLWHHCNVTYSGSHGLQSTLVQVTSSVPSHCLTHWGHDKMAAILQTTF